MPESATLYHDIATITGKSSNLNGVLKAPVTIAAEIIQFYHISELPAWMQEAAMEWIAKESNRPDLPIVPILKPYAELEKMIKDVNNIPVFENHVETDVAENDPRGIGFLKDLYADPKSRSAKGFVYFKTKKVKIEDVERIKKGDIIDVSIGGTTKFGPGGIFNNRKYFASQVDMSLNHLAFLPRSEGRCGKDHCGINKDSAQKIVSDAVAIMHPITDQKLIDDLTVIVDSKISDHENESPNSQTLIPLNTNDLKLISDLNTFTTQVYNMTLEEELAKLKMENEKLRDSISSTKLSELNDTLKNSKIEIETLKKLNSTISAENVNLKTDLEDANKFKAEKEAEEVNTIVKELVDSKIYTEEEVNDKCIKELRVIQSTLQKASGKMTDAKKKQFGFPKPGETNRNAKLGGTDDLLDDAAPTYEDIYGVKT